MTSNGVKIRVQDLVRLFGPVRAVDGISFEVSEGEIVGFLGPNGAGKTTTMRILTGFLRPTMGRAEIAGFDVTQNSLQARRHLGYLPENVALYGEMRVEEYLEYRAKLKGVPRSERRKRIDYVIERCRLDEMRRRLCGTLSKGYRQRVGLADALVHNPDILILDEPTVGLDPLQVRETRAVIRQLGEDHTVLLSTHILPEVEMVCERVIIINRGKIALDSPLEELRRSQLIEVGVDADGAPVTDIVAMLRSVSGVREVRPPRDGSEVFELVLEDNADPRNQIARMILDRGWKLQHLALRRETLEDRFVDVIVRAEA